jgi:hypothetical protein
MNKTFPRQLIAFFIFSPSSDSNYNMNFNQIPLPPPILPSLLTQKQKKITNNEHDIEQSKLKNMLIDELKSFFASRNNQVQSSISTQEYSTEQRQHVNPISLKKQIIQRTLNSEQVKITKGDD